jgi:hypothetical protein
MLNNCTTPTINQKNNQISIYYKSDLLYKEEGKVIYSNTIHLSNINVYQYIYKNKSNFISYEYVKAENGYKFTKGIKRTVGIIFDTNAYTLDYTKGNLYFFHLDLKSGRLYLILENINSSALKLIYGLSKENYLSMINRLKSNDVSILINSKKLINSKNKVSSNLKDKDTKDISLLIKTKWTPKVIIMDQVVAKPTGRGSLGRR